MTCILPVEFINNSEGSTFFVIRNTALVPHFLSDWPLLLRCLNAASLMHQILFNTSKLFSYFWEQKRFRIVCAASVVGYGQPCISLSV